MKVISKYLASYAEKEADKVFHSLHNSESKWDEVITIPLCREVDFLPLIDSIDQASFHKKTLLIFLINGQEKDKLENQLTFEIFLELGVDALSTNLYWKRYSKQLNILILDRGTQEFFPPKNGVGLARKILADIALKLINEKKILSEWIHCTDGDATLSPDYFNYEKEEGASALLTPYQHLSEKNPKLKLYDLSLKYYEAGLSYAGSPYAFPTIGSTISISAPHYAMVRGFPKREAAEDFYLLNKLAKVGKVLKRKNGLISLKDRESDRVPFGTGAATAKLDIETFSLYHPQCFIFLKAWLDSAEEYFHTQNETLLKYQLGEKMIQLVEQFGWKKMLSDSILNRKTIEEAKKEFHRSFDAFQTLKMVHQLRDLYYPNLPWRELSTFLNVLMDRKLNHKTSAPPYRTLH